MGSDDDRAQSYKTECLQTDGEEELSRFRGIGLNPDPKAEWLMFIPTKVEGTWAVDRDRRYYTQADCESVVKLAQAKGWG